MPIEKKWESKDLNCQRREEGFFWKRIWTNVFLRCFFPYKTAPGSSWGVTIYIYISFQESLLSSCMSLPVQTFRKMLFNHSFPSEGIEFSVFFHSLFRHPSLLYHSILWGGGGCCMSCFSFIILPRSVIPYHWAKSYSTLIHSFGRGLLLYMSFLKNLSSCMSLPFHSFTTCYSTIRSFLTRLNSLYLFKDSFVILHCSASPYF